MLDQITDVLLAFASSPYSYLVVFAVCLIDGFFPPVPSETIVVSVAAVATSTGQPVLAGVVVVAALGAVAGDNITYTIGRAVGRNRFRWMRRRRISAVLDWAGAELARRPASLVVTGRYIPVGRIAVNVMAGSTGMPRRRFVPLTVVAGLSWAVYSVAIGLIAGAWVDDNPLLAAGIAIVGALAIGVVVDRVIAALSRRRAAGTREVGMMVR